VILRRREPYVLHVARIRNLIRCKVKSETTVTETISSSRGGILDAWSDSEWNDGVQIDQMEEINHPGHSNE
jgi:hypothetical protein